MSNRRYILMSSSAGLVIRVTGAMLAMGSQILIARVIGREQFGIYVYGLSVITLIAIFARMGIDSALPRFLPVMLATGKHGEYRGTLRLAFGAPLAVAVVLALGAAAFYLVVKPGDAAVYAPALLIMLVALPTFAVTYIRRTAMICLRRVVWAELPSMVLRPVFLIIGALVVYAMVEAPTARDMAFVFLGSVSLAFGIGCYKLWRAQPKDLSDEPPTYPLAKLLRVAGPLLLMAGFVGTIGEFTVVCLGYYQDPERVAIYGAAVRLSAMVAFALQAANTVLNPLIAQLFHTGKFAELRASLRDAAWWMFVLTALAILTTVLAGKLILSLFGPGFTDGYPILLLLLAGQAANALTGSVGSIMKMCNRHNQACAILMLSAVANVVLCLTLIPRYGAFGAGLSVAISQTMSNTLMLVYCCRKLGLNPTVLPLPLAAMPPHVEPDDTNDTRDADA